jgi:hypothetical protein
MQYTVTRNLKRYNSLQVNYEALFTEVVSVSKPPNETRVQVCLHVTSSIEIH